MTIVSALKKLIKHLTGIDAEGQTIEEVLKSFEDTLKKDEEPVDTDTPAEPVDPDPETN